MLAWSHGHLITSLAAAVWRYDGSTIGDPGQLGWRPRPLGSVRRRLRRRYLRRVALYVRRIIRSSPVLAETSCWLLPRYLVDDWGLTPSTV